MLPLLACMPDVCLAIKRETIDVIKLLCVQMRGIGLSERISSLVDQAFIT
jgi:hypothetical protein